jgi:TP901-1 family phage major tail protein
MNKPIIPEAFPLRLNIQHFAGESRGIDFAIFIETTDGTFSQIAGQRGGTFNMSSDEIDLTSKDNYGFADRDYGVQDWSIDGDGVYIENDASHDAILDAFLAREVVTVRWQFPSGKRYEGEAIISDFPIEAPYDDVATYSITLLGKGAFREVASGTGV